MCYNVKQATMNDQDLQRRIITTMRAVFPPADPALAPLYGMLQYHLGWLDEQLQPVGGSGGKLVRPVLAVLANRVFGGVDEHALPLAAALQLLHDFSLIHDDIQDNSSMRRGRRTTWQIWGLAHGINAGDTMFALAHRALFGLAPAGVPADRTLRVMRDFEETILRICEGQYLDMSAEGNMELPVDDYLRMIRGKTAALTAAATGLGAALSSGDEAEIAAMWRFGELLGMAFQMQDDLLDIWGAPELTGKPFAADLQQRKMSLPVIHGLAHASSTDRQRFVELYRRPELSRADLETLMAILDRSESRSYVEQLARDEHALALDALSKVRPVDSAACDELGKLAELLLERKT